MKTILSCVTALTLVALPTLASAETAPAASATPKPAAPVAAAPVAAAPVAAAAAAVPAAVKPATTTAPAAPRPALAAAPAVAPRPAPVAAAAAPEAEEATAVEPAPVATPLATRPSKPLTLASPSSEETPVIYKLLLGLGVAAGVGLWLRHKRGMGALIAPRRIDILGRTSVGVRSELLVVEVEGTRLLLGMTPSAIQTLAVLDAEAPAPVEESPAELEAAALNERTRVVEREKTPAPAGPLLEVADKARALLGGMRTTARPQPLPTTKRPPAGTSKLPRVAGQAKGLLLALEAAEGARDSDARELKASSGARRAGER